MIYCFTFAGISVTPTMDIVLILLGVGAILLIYQLVYRRDNDRLDKHGRPLNRKKR